MVEHGSAKIEELPENDGSSILCEAARTKPKPRGRVSPNHVAESLRDSYVASWRDAIAPPLASQPAIIDA
jgi:hypothetical protein